VTTRKRPDITTEIVTITPARAKKLLGANTANRHLRPTVVTGYAAQMTAGEWQLNGDAIRIGDDGTLLDGQHRLTACVESGVPFDTILITGLPTEARPTIDTGVKRTVGDYLAHLGHPNSTNLAAATKMAYLFDRGNPFEQMSLTPTQAADYIDDNPAIVPAISAGGHVYKAVGWSASMWGAAVFLTGRADPDLAAAFFDDVVQGVNLHHGDPALALRQAIGRHRSQTRRYAQSMRGPVQLAYVLKAWNASWSGEKVKLLRFNEGEPFPTVAGTS
jgi:hypothetical protein